MTGEEPAASTAGEGPIDEDAVLVRAGRFSAVSTKAGDDGTTGLLYGGPRIPKDDPRTEAFGTIDEAVASLGLVRAELDVKRRLDELPPTLAMVETMVLRFQRELFVAASELAANPDAWDRLRDGTTRVGAEMVAGVEQLLADFEARMRLPREFVVPGETRTSAGLEMARTIIRRAERRAVTLDRAGLVPGPHLLPYLNRLADLLWVMARTAEQAESRQPTAARTGTRSRPADDRSR